MKVGKYIFYFFILLLIGACSTYSKNGVYLVKNQYGKYDYDDIIRVHFLTNNINDDILEIELPFSYNGVGGGYQLFSTLLPIPIKNDRFEDNTNIFYIRILNSYYLLDDFKNNLKIFLIVDGKTYISKKDKLFNFLFPLQIKDVKKGTLVIEYNGIRKEIEFEHGYKWFYYH